MQLSVDCMKWRGTCQLEERKEWSTLVDAGHAFDVDAWNT
jgi:hypothetical protein